MEATLRERAGELQACSKHALMLSRRLWNLASLLRAEDCEAKVMTKRPLGTGRPRANALAPRAALAAKAGLAAKVGLAHADRRTTGGLLSALIASTALLATVGVPSASATGSRVLYAWGSNNYGQLGDRTAKVQLSPEQTSLAPGVTPVAISAGTGFSLAIGSDRNLYAWGTGYLGDGSGKPDFTPKEITIAPGVTPKAISAGGDDFSLAIGSNGKLYAWGSDRDGQLGDGKTNDDVESPEAVTLAPDVAPTAISAGYSSSLAIGSNDDLYAWGSNGTGQLGDGTTTNHDTPEVVTLPTGVEPTAISEGNGVSYVIGSDGNLYAWGDNEFGQLGDDTNNGPVSCGFSNVPCSKAPVGVTVNVGSAQFPEWGTFQATAVTASQENWGVLAIGADGNLYAWGFNYSCAAGQLPDELSPQAVTLPVGVTPTAISAGECDDYALGSNGTLFGWGWNVDRELGDGGVTPQTKPQEIPLSRYVTPTGIAANYNFALAIATDNTPPSVARKAASAGGTGGTLLTIGLVAVAVAAILAGGLFIARRRSRPSPPSEPPVAPV
jgi:alpha-tubulin suppressor-like RCC1 family protein